MGKYIEAERLKELIKEIDMASCISEEWDGFYHAIGSVLEVIDSLQQEKREVDLDGEITCFIESHYHVRNDETLENDCDPLTTQDFEDIARHFAEWGAIHLNARKGE